LYFKRYAVYLYLPYYFCGCHAKDEGYKQVTIPKEVREEISLRQGEVVMVESVSEEEIIVKRFRRIKDPLKVLVGKTPSDRHIPAKELEEKAETR